MLENVFMRDMGVPGITAQDGRRLEILATGLPLHRGVPLAVDASMVSPLHADGRPWARADTVDGVGVRRAEDHKKTTYPELAGSSVVRLTTVACEVGGRWSEASLTLLRGLAAARAREAPFPLRRATAGAWRARWLARLSVAQQDALAATLVDDGVVALDAPGAAGPSDVDVWVDGWAA